MDAHLTKDEQTAIGPSFEEVARSSSADDPDRELRWAKWRAENAEAIESSNAWVERHGLPLARYRMF